MLNNFKNNLKISSIFIPYILSVNAFVFLFFILFANGNTTQKILLAVSLIVSSIYLVNKIGKKQKQEVDIIKRTIQSIRLNEVAGSDGIKLGHSLADLEDEIKKMYSKAVDDMASMRRLEQARTEFLGNVSHELRTPIFAIQGYVETLINGAVNDANVNISFLEKVNNHALNLGNLLNDLIDISMIESGQMKMSFRYFPINEYLTELVGEFTHFAEEKGIELIYKPVREDLLLFGDKERLRQVLVNLFTNSIKYTEVGKIELVVTEKEKAAVISVKDTGSGIPETDLPRIFERFYRVDKERSRLVGGTGLGLAIVKHIIEAHGSKVTVKSRVGAGSEFAFSLKK